MSIQELSTLIKTGQGSLRDDPQSGSILKLLGENGFKSKIEAGAANGHTYTIIHNPPSTEFLLVDMWNEGEHPRKAYHAFTVKTSSNDSAIKPSQQNVEPEIEHPLITTLKQLNKEADRLLQLTQKYA